MSHDVFHEIYLHLTWHTKNDLPLITPEVESAIYEFIRIKCRNTKGVYFEGVGGTETHVHVAINIEPFVCISDFVGELKGFGSHETNKLRGEKVVEWQRGYGVVSFSKSHKKWVLDYIANQQVHHARGTLSEKLERTDEE
ncbi:MAG: IS200/IS605 family transposase [Armatimonadota bacterium]